MHTFVSNTTTNPYVFYLFEQYQCLVESSVMNFEIIKGKRGGDLLYVPSEKMLYVFKVERNGSKEFVCYQTIMTDTKKKDHEEHIPCTSRIRLLSTDICERSSLPHTNHPNHQIIADDKKKVAIMKQNCQHLRENHPEAAHKIPNRHIFQREIAKYGISNDILVV